MYSRRSYRKVVANDGRKEQEDEEEPADEEEQENKDEEADDDDDERLSNDHQSNKRPFQDIVTKNAPAKRPERALKHLMLPLQAHKDPSINSFGDMKRAAMTHHDQQTD